MKLHTTFEGCEWCPLAYRGMIPEELSMLCHPSDYRTLSNFDTVKISDHLSFQTNFQDKTPKPPRQYDKCEWAPKFQFMPDRGRAVKYSRGHLSSLRIQCNGSQNVSSLRMTTYDINNWRLKMSKQSLRHFFCCFFLSWQAIDPNPPDVKKFGVY